MIEFNSHLIEAFNSSSDESKKVQTVLIAKKNLEISRKYYMQDSIYTVKAELALASNHISNLNFNEAQECIANMRKIVQRFHDDNPRDLMNQYLFLGQCLIAITLMNTASADSAERILSYVLQKQTEYCENCKTHPFLEQTIINLAIFYRSQQQYQISLSMWQNLLKIQEQVYGLNSEVLIYTMKNLGICYLALGVPEKAEEYYLKALDIMNTIKADNVSDELLNEDREQMAAIYFNLYLSASTNDDRIKAKEYNLKALEYHRLISSEQSLQVSNCYFIQAQLCLKTGSPDEAIEWMSKAMSIFNEENKNYDYKKGKDEMLLIQVRYLLALTSMYFIKGNFAEAKQACQSALEICQDSTKHTYDTVEEFKKFEKEARSTYYKCEGKIMGVSALDIKPKEVKIAAVETVAKPSLVPAIGMFGAVSSVSFAMSYMFMKHLKH